MQHHQGLSTGANNLHLYTPTQQISKLLNHNALTDNNILIAGITINYYVLSKSYLQILQNKLLLCDIV